MKLDFLVILKWKFRVPGPFWSHLVLGQVKATCVWPCTGCVWLLRPASVHHAFASDVLHLMLVFLPPASTMAVQGCSLLTQWACLTKQQLQRMLMTDLKGTNLVAAVGPNTVWAGIWRVWVGFQLAVLLWFWCWWRCAVDVLVLSSSLHSD